MTQEQIAQAHTPAVLTLQPSGDPVQDHVLDEIQHPEDTEAFFKFACKSCGGPVTIRIFTDSGDDEQ